MRRLQKFPALVLLIAMGLVVGGPSAPAAHPSTTFFLKWANTELPFGIYYRSSSDNWSTGWKDALPRRRRSLE
jgi:hypothetical protein